VDDLAGYDVLVGLDVRGLLEDFPVDPAAFRLRDLSPPRKTWRLNRAGRTLRLTPALLITSSVGISKPLADPAVVSRYVTAGHTGRLRRRLESDLYDSRQIASNGAKILLGEAPNP